MAKVEQADGLGVTGTDPADDEHAAAASKQVGARNQPLVRFGAEPARSPDIGDYQRVAVQQHVE